MKFKLNNSLNEAYAENMPQSLKDFLKNNKWIKNNLLRNRDLALDRANFIEYPVPTTNRDPLFKDTTKIIFYDFGNGKIYITGTNDDDRYFYNNSGNMIYNKYLSNKQLIDKVKAVYLLDMNDSNNFVGNKRQTRKDYNLNNDPFTRHKPEEFKGWYAKDMLAKLDKSGYLRDPEKYVKKMYELGLYDPAKKTKSAYDKIAALKSDIIAALEDVDIEGTDNYSAMNAIQNAMGYARSAMGNYNDWISGIDTRLKRKEQGIWDAKQTGESLRDLEKAYIGNIEDNIRRANSYVDKYIGYAVDWDTEDEVF